MYVNEKQEKFVKYLLLPIKATLYTLYVLLVVASILGVSIYMLISILEWLA